MTFLEFLTKTFGCPDVWFFEGLDIQMMPGHPAG